MANFDEFKQKAKDTMETIADRSVELYKIAEEKTKIFAKITKLGAEIALEKGNVRKLYREIGKKYYELHKASPEDALAQSCTEVTSSLERIDVKQKEIDELKNSLDLGAKEDGETVENRKDDVIEVTVEEYDKPEQDEDNEEPEPVKIIITETVEPADDTNSKTPNEKKSPSKPD